MAKSRHNTADRTVPQMEQLNKKLLLQEDTLSRNSCKIEQMQETFSRLTQSRDSQRDQINALQENQRTVTNDNDKAINDITNLTNHMKTFRQSVTEHLEEIWEALHSAKGKGKGKRWTR